MTNKILFLLLILFSISSIAQGQDAKEDEKIVITTKSGDIIKGTLKSQDAAQMIIQTSFGEAIVQKSDISNLKINDGTYATRSTEHSGSHYLINQSAFGLKKGQSYYENVYLFLNSYTTGITDNFSFTIGADVSPLLFGGQRPGIYLTPKVHFPYDGGAFSVGSTLLSYEIDGESLTLGILQGNLSFGDLDRNLTIGTGFGYTFEDGFEDSVVPIFLSGITRVSDKISLVSENWIAVGDFQTVGILSFGIRIHSQTKSNFLTISLFRPTVDTGPLLAVPFFSGTVAIK